MRLRLVITEVFNGLRRNSTMALSVVLVTFVSLAFVGAAALIQIQVGQLKDDWYDRVEVSIFLCAENARSLECAAGAATPAQEDAIYHLLTQGPVSEYVEQVYYESREEAYEKLRRIDTGGLYASLTPADLEASFRVKLVDPEQFAVIADAVQGMPGVSMVHDQREIFGELFRLLNAATFVTAGLAGVMLIAAMLLITTTIRLSALSRRRETTIMRMVGSSRTFIQLPFMLEGAVAATAGAALAIAGLWFSVRYFVEEWLKDTIAWVDYIGEQDVWTVAPWLLAIAVALAVIASSLTLGRYTRA